ncbi:MAG: PAS domain-containing protein, partial [Phenylobacterium sp.]
MEIELSRLIDALPGLVWTTTPDGTSEFINERWREYAGLSLDEVRRDGWTATIHPEDMPRARACWDALIAAGEAGEIEARLRRFDGAYRRFTIKTCPVPDDRGVIVGWCGINTEIEDRRLAEDALLAQERRFQFILDGLPAIVALFTSQGRIAFCNKQMLDYLDETFEQVQAKASAYNFHPDERDEILADWAASVRSGQPFDRDTRLRRADGVYRWHRTRVLPLRNAAGEIDLWYGLSIDIEDTKRAEAKLAAEKRLLEMVAKGVALPQVLDTLAHLVESLATGSYCSILLVDEGGDRFRVGTGPSLPASYNAILDGKTIDPRYGPCSLAVVESVPVITSDLVHDARWAESIWPPLMREYGLRSCWSMPILSIAGKVLGVFAIYRREPQGPNSDEQELIDRFSYLAGIAIERAESEAALGRARAELAHVTRVTALSALTASIAHEVNQPLAGIITNASTCLRMLAADPPNLDGARATAQRTIRDGNRASEVIQRLRGLFSRRAPIMEPMDLNDAAQEVLALSAIDLQRRRVIVRTDLAEDLPLVRGDRIQLQQVILNLVMNAADAMAGVEDRPRELGLATARDSGGQAQLSVRDAGAGFEPQGVERLFDAFYTTKAEGMGVGLSVSRAIIQGHEGRLWATANDGPGATFTFAIPCRCDLPDAADAPH